MQRVLAQGFSYVFHPLWMPLILFLLADHLDPNLLVIPELRPFIIICLVVNILAPAIGVYIMIRRGSISDINIRKRRERFAPFVLIIFYYLCTYFIFRTNDLPVSRAFMAMIFAVPISLAVAMLITLKWKISVHMLGQGGAIGALWAISVLHNVPVLLPLCLLMIVAGFVGFSRVYLKAHTNPQVYAGFLLGLIANFAIIRFGLMV